MIDIFVDIVQRVTPERYHCEPCHFETRLAPLSARRVEIIGSAMFIDEPPPAGMGL
jgi:hypothetical protein